MIEQEHMMESEKKKTVCIVTRIAAACLVLAILFVILGFVEVSYGLAIVLPFLAVASLIRISLHSERLKGKSAALLILALSSFFIYSITLYQVPRAKTLPSGVVCGTNLKGLGTALRVYAQDFGGLLPSDDWCDQLIQEADVGPNSFLCYRSDSITGESDYCLNRYAAGMRLADLPDDMVLLFETAFEPAEGQRRESIRRRPGFERYETFRIGFSGNEQVYPDRWNQVGGPERLDFRRHEQGCNVLFADETVRFVTLSELPSLRWNVENTVFFETPTEWPAQKESITMPDPDIVLSVLCGVSLVSAAYILVKRNAMRYWKFVLFLAVLSAATGWVFGIASSMAYTLREESGAYAGIFFGALTGACFAPLLAGSSARIRRLPAFGWFSTSVGMVAGVVCSTLVHLALMIVERTANPFGIVIGIPFGAFAGAILGAIAGAVVKKYYPAEQTDDV